MPERKTRELPRDADGKFTDGKSKGKEKSLEEIAKEIFPHLRSGGKPKEGNATKTTLTTSETNDIIKLPDIQIGRSLGAKARNWDVLDRATGKRYKFVEGTHLQNVEVFAGGRSKTPYKKSARICSKRRQG